MNPELRRIPRRYWIFAVGLSLVILTASIFGWITTQDRFLAMQPVATMSAPKTADETSKLEEARRIALEQAEKDRIAAEQAAAAKMFTDIATAVIGSRDRERRRGSSAPTPSPSLFDAIDEAVAELKQASIAFNAPKTLELAQTEQIQLLLDLTQPPESLRQGLTSEGERRSSQVGVAARMEARLTGEQFQITALAPEEQLISSKGRTEWRWDIRPKATGSHELHLTLTALFDVEGKPGRRHIRTFDETIEVDVTVVDLVSGFLERNWQWLWTAILVPVGIYFWKRRRPEAGSVKGSPTG